MDRLPIEILANILLRASRFQKGGAAFSINRASRGMIRKPGAFASAMRAVKGDDDVMFFVGRFVVLSGASPMSIGVFDHLVDKFSKLSPTEVLSASMRFTLKSAIWDERVSVVGTRFDVNFAMLAVWSHALAKRFLEAVPGGGGSCSADAKDGTKDCTRESPIVPFVCRFMRSKAGLEWYLTEHLGPSEGWSVETHSAVETAASHAIRTAFGPGVHELENIALYERVLGQNHVDWRIHQTLRGEFIGKADVVHPKAADWLATKSASRSEAWRSWFGNAVASRLIARNASTPQLVVDALLGLHRHAPFRRTASRTPCLYDFLFASIEHDRAPVVDALVGEFFGARDFEALAVRALQSVSAANAACSALLKRLRGATGVMTVLESWARRDALSNPAFYEAIDALVALGPSAQVLQRTPAVTTRLLREGSGTAAVASFRIMPLSAFTQAQRETLTLAAIYGRCPNELADIVRVGDSGTHTGTQTGRTEDEPSAWELALAVLLHDPKRVGDPAASADASADAAADAAHDDELFERMYDVMVADKAPGYASMRRIMGAFHPTATIRWERIERKLKQL